MMAIVMILLWLNAGGVSAAPVSFLVDCGLRSAPGLLVTFPCHKVKGSSSGTPGISLGDKGALQIHHLGPKPRGSPSVSPSLRGSSTARGAALGSVAVIWNGAKARFCMLPA